MEIKFDSEADAVYVQFSSRPYGWGRELDDWRRIDYASDDQPIGVELLCVSNGVNIDQLPYWESIGEALADRGIRVYRLEQYSFTETGYSETGFKVWPASIAGARQGISVVREAVTA